MFFLCVFRDAQILFFGCWRKAERWDAMIVHDDFGGRRKNGVARVALGNLCMRVVFYKKTACRLSACVRFVGTIGLFGWAKTNNGGRTTFA